MTYENPNVLDTITENLLSALLYPRLFRRYLPMLSLGAGERILEVGCGGGAMTRQLARAAGDGTTITCVDVNSFWLDRAGIRMRGTEGITFVNGDIGEMDLAEGSFSLIFIHYMLHDVPPRHRAAIANRLSGALARGGRLFVCEPTKPSHGMPAEEIDSLFSGVGLEKEGENADSFPIMGALYRALFRKP